MTAAGCGITTVTAGRAPAVPGATCTCAAGRQCRLPALLVGAQAQVGGDGVQRLGVLHALLPDVQLAQEHAKSAGLKCTRRGGGGGPEGHGARKAGTGERVRQASRRRAKCHSHTRVVCNGGPQRDTPRCQLLRLPRLEGWCCVPTWRRTSSRCALATCTSPVLSSES